MNYVAIDTSGKNLTLVISIDGKNYIYFNADSGVNHSVEVVTELEKLAESIPFNLKNVDFISVVVGAGSFTGIRIGVSVAKALALTYSKPMVSITSFDTIAYNNTNGRRLAIIDAKHNNFYACGYENGEVVFEASFIDEGKVRELAKDYILMSFESIQGFDTQVVSVAEGLIKATERKANLLEDAENVIPLYIRKSQAEEGR